MTNDANPTPSLPELLAQMAELTAVAQAMSHDLPGQAAIVPTSGAGLDGLDAHAARQQITSMRDAALAQAEAAQAMARSIRDEVERQVQAMRQQMAPLLKQVEQMRWTLDTLGLYLLDDVSVVCLRDGQPADPGVPITVRQMVLAADEESRLAAEDGGIDIADLPQFHRWLLADPAHLDQMLPEAKGVVAVMARRSERDYGDPWSNVNRNAANRHTWLLLRNGDQIFVVDAPMEFGARLVPTKDEFTGFFRREVRDPHTRELSYEQLIPGTHEYDRAFEAAGERQRHFMRIGLLLQGLIDQTEVFAPLPAQGVSFQDPASYADGRIRMLANAEMALDDGGKAFFTWLAERNALLRPGMRLVGAFNGTEFRDANDSHDNRAWTQKHSRLWPETAKYPPSGTVLRVEDRKPTGELVVRYDRNEKIWVQDDWGRYRERAPERRASVTIKTSDRFILPFDVITAEEITYYLQRSTERRHYMTLIPLMKAALKAKADEAAAEAPFRQLLLGQIHQHNGVTFDEAEAALEGLIAWWKTTIKWHRPLVHDDPAEETKALRRIVAEDKARRTAGAQASATEERMVTRLRAEHPDAIVVARNRSGRYVAFTPAAQSGPWLHEHTAGAKTQTLTREWVLPGAARAAALRVLWAEPRWDGWDLTASPAEHLSGPEVTQVLSEVPALLEDGTHILAMVDTGRPRELHVYTHVDVATKMARRLLTSDDWRHVTTTIPRWTFRWSRDRQGRVRVARAGKSQQSWRGTSWEGLERGHVNRPDPWDNLAAGQRLLHLDPQVLTDAEGQLELLKALAVRRGELMKVRAAIDTCLEAGWVEAKTAAEHAKHIAEFGDNPAMWEAHRQTLNLTYPHRSSMFRSEWERALDRAVQSGRNVHGLTVAEAVIGKLKGTDTVPDLIAGLRITLPEDLRQPDVAEAITIRPAAARTTPAPR